MSSYYEENKIYVGGFRPDTTIQEIEDAFRRFGLCSARIMMHKDTGRCRGYGFVTFKHKRGMEDAIREMNDTCIRGWAIFVDRAHRKKAGGCYTCGLSGHWAHECPSDGMVGCDDGDDGGGGDKAELQGGTMDLKPAVNKFFSDEHSFEGENGDMAAQKVMSTKIEGFPVPNKFAFLYKAVYERHGHLATKTVIRNSKKAITGLVTDLLGVISDMWETSFTDLNASLLKSWDSKVATAETVEFNVGWLRERVNELKAEFASTETLQSSLEDEEELLKVTQEEFVVASKVRETLRMQLLAAENHADEVERRLKECKIKVESQVAEKERNATRQHQSVLTGFL